MALLMLLGAGSISLRGQGGSDTPQDAKSGWTLNQHASDIAEFLETDIKQPPVLIGHSLGGLIVQRYITGKYGDGSKLSGAVLLASAPTSGNSSMIKRFFVRNPLNAAKLTWYFVRKSFLKSPEATRWLFFSEDLPKDDLQRYYDLMVSQKSSAPILDVRTLSKQMKELGAPPSQLPVLVMGAEDDVTVDREGVQETADFYGVDPVILPRMAHDMMLDTRWEETAETIYKWLSDL